MELKIIDSVVILSQGTDTILLTVDLPESCYPYKGNATLRMNAAQDTGVDYVLRNFKILPRVVKRT